MPPSAGGHSNFVFFFLNDTATTEIYTLSLHDALPISCSISTEPITSGWWRLPPRKPQAGLLEKESRLRMPRAGELGPGGDLHPSALPKRGMSPTCFTDRVGRRPPLHTTPAPTSGLTPDPFRPSEPANRATQQGHSWQAVSCSRAGHPARNG